MKHLRLFETTAAFDTAKPTLEDPWVTLTEDDEKVHFIPTPSNPNIVIKLIVPSSWPNEIPLGGGDLGYDDTLYFTPSTECEDIILDGVSIGAVDYYTVSKGMHTIEYIMKDKTKIYDDQFTEFGLLGIQSVEIPDSVTSIGKSAFSGCSSLTSIKIPNSVTSIGFSAFIGCRSLINVTYNGTITQWNAIEKGLDWQMFVPFLPT